MQLTHSSERAHAAAQQQQLERTLSDAQAARADAEARVREAEAKLCDMRAALDSQERLLRVLREQVAEGGVAAARVEDLEAAVQVCGHDTAGDALGDKSGIDDVRNHGRFSARCATAVVAGAKLVPLAQQA
jgi:hypothetical protein